MISVVTGSSASDAVHYFSADNYYSRDEGLSASEWYGEGAKTLGLEGQITKEELQKILSGEVDGQKLGRLVKNEKGESEVEHRPYIDVTFSAPKSVSLLAEVAGMQEIRQAHEQAVKETLDWMQRDLAATRLSGKRGMQVAQTGNLVVGLFRHNTSRELDPQTHTHAVIANATAGADGKWRSLHNDPIYDKQHSIGAAYMSTLAAKVKELGFEIEVKDKYGNFEIAGVSMEGLEHFSQRRQQIREALQVRGLDIDSASAELREKATLMTRQSKKSVVHQELQQEWKDRARWVGLDLDKVVSDARGRTPAGKDRTVDANTVREVDQRVNPVLSDRSVADDNSKVFLSGLDGHNAAGVEPQSRSGVSAAGIERGTEALRFAAAHLMEREMVVPADLLVRTATQHSIGTASFTEIDAAYKSLVKDRVLLESASPKDRAEKFVTTNRLLRGEENLLATLAAGRDRNPAVLSGDGFDKLLGQFEKAEQGRLRDSGFSLTPGQKDAVKLVLTSPDKYVDVQGDAGTGKTTMLRAIRSLGEDAGVFVRGMSVSGSAAEKMELESGIPSSTLKMFLIKEQRAQKEMEALKASGKTVDRGREIWVVDESSFVGNSDMRQLLRLAEGCEAKVMFSGDMKQLSSPEAGKPFELSQQVIPVAHMKEIRRQNTDTLRAVVSDTVNRQYARSFDRLVSAGCVKEVADQQKLYQSVVGSYMQGDRKETLVITPFNRDRTEINRQIRDELRSRGELRGEDKEVQILVNRGLTKAQLQHAQYYRSGDVLLSRRGYKELGVPDNTYLKVAGVDRKTNTLSLVKPDGQRVSFNPTGKTSMEAYREESRAVAVGDQIRITRSEGHLRTGNMGTITSLRGSLATLKLESGAEKTLDVSKQRHWDHGYALTVHASQGQGARKVIVHMPVPAFDNKEHKANPLHEIAKIFGERSYYVSVTRVKDALEIHTDSASKARDYIMQKQDKSSSYEAMSMQKSVQPEREHGIGGREM